MTRESCYKGFVAERTAKDTRFYYNVDAGQFRGSALRLYYTVDRLGRDKGY